MNELYQLTEKNDVKNNKNPAQISCNKRKDVDGNQCK